MYDRMNRPMSVGKIEIAMSTISDIDRNRYRSGWAVWREFCDGVESSPHFGPAKEGWGELLLDFFTCEYRIMGVVYSGLLDRYAKIRLVRLVGWCGVRKDSVRIRIATKAIKRPNPAGGEMTVADELLGWIQIHFADSRSLGDNQLLGDLVNGFISVYVSPMPGIFKKKVWFFKLRMDGSG